MSRSSYVPLQRIRNLLIALLAVVVVSVAMFFHARWRIASGQDTLAARRRSVKRLGFVDLALSSSARWLRAPSQAERTAALSDGPIAFDSDPAGSLIGPSEGPR